MAVENRRRNFTVREFLEHGFNSLVALRKIDHLQSKKRGTIFRPTFKNFRSIRPKAVIRSRLLPRQGLQKMEHLLLLAVQLPEGSEL